MGWGVVIATYICLLQCGRFCTYYVYFTKVFISIYVCVHMYMPVVFLLLIAYYYRCCDYYYCCCYRYMVIMLSIGIQLINKVSNY